ncbi:hypothetical protein [Xanthomonas hortorum]|uniref:Uncharacterized protein n=1 Tax=Xanthomonas hortorum TaxID=56454 RepID=A0AA47IF16_9XANT|nr:hypothetical protein [Xanthomonas hortorum]MCE4360539.1 hypothetical protein [Xanthomonas hortorum pv. taraxaci]NMI54067.1 hypothetical protein [Xanthomonas hortorum pv. taraxaci]WAH66888.1 hypothetical protein OEG85_24285 [Xanthomonas hortorum]CAD0362250.1 hypothetical protein NCPPB940_44460 [Xanthomonas hortorum pv. taraxaci]CAD0362258.1 hypothetical protein NCPPB940_44460 [Xanthomonas hortorum pv. taraxaci]
MSTEPTNEELSAGYARQIDAASRERQANDLKRLERAGKAAAAMDELAEEPTQEKAGARENTHAAQDKARDAETERSARKLDLLERFKEKAARDREQERGRGR